MSVYLPHLAARQSVDIVFKANVACFSFFNRGYDAGQNWNCLRQCKNATVTTSSIGK